jgi:hypothetical protein
MVQSYKLDIAKHQLIWFIHSLAIKYGEELASVNFPRGSFPFIYDGKVTVAVISFDRVETGYNIYVHDMQMNNDSSDISISFCAQYKKIHP